MVFGVINQWQRWFIVSFHNVWYFRSCQESCPKKMPFSNFKHHKPNPIHLYTYSITVLHPRCCRGTPPRPWRCTTTVYVVGVVWRKFIFLLICVLRLIVEAYFQPQPFPISFRCRVCSSDHFLIPYFSFLFLGSFLFLPGSFLFSFLVRRSVLWRPILWYNQTRWEYY